MGFNTMNPGDAVSKQLKLHEMFGEGYFDPKLASAKAQELRPIGPVIAYEYYWFTILTKNGKIAKIPKLCIDLDPYTDEYVSEVCPFRASGLGERSRVYVFNVISRKAQDEMPARLKPPRAEESKVVHIMKECPDFPGGWEVYRKTVGSDTYTPVRVFIATATGALAIADMSKDNIVKGITYDASDVDYGFDILYKHDKNGAGTGRHIYQRGEDSPLTDEELDYHVYELDVLKFPTQKEAEKEWREIEGRLTEAEASDDSMRGRKSAARLDEDDEDLHRTRPQPQERERGAVASRASTPRPATSRFSRAAKDDPEIPF